MRDVTTETWGQNELFELLALMVMGTCVWIVGARFGVFETVSRYAITHDLIDLVMLSSCMGIGVFAATIRKSILLRRAIIARMAAEALAEWMKELLGFRITHGPLFRRILNDRIVEPLKDAAVLPGSLSGMV